MEGARFLFLFLSGRALSGPNTSLYMTKHTGKATLCKPASAFVCWIWGLQILHEPVYYIFMRWLATFSFGLSKMLVEIGYLYFYTEQLEWLLYVWLQILIHKPSVAAHSKVHTSYDTCTVLFPTPFLTTFPTFFSFSDLSYSYVWVIWIYAALIFNFF